MKVLVYSSKKFEVPYLEKANKGKHELTFIKEALSLKTVMLSMGYDAISIFAADEADAVILEKLNDLNIKHITLRSAGYDNVDLKTASNLNIKVANVPAYSPYAIAEHATALLLALNRKLIESNKRINNFNFTQDNLIGFDLNNKTIGIVGTGKIGSVMCKIMHGFGCKLLGYDIKESKDLVNSYQLQYVPLKTLCKEADVISLHIPLTTETHHLINDSLIYEMKEGVIIINTARGAVINTEHIIAGLEKGKIGALGIDVYEKEKGVFFSNDSQKTLEDNLLVKLIAMPNVLITGHHAFLTKEAITNIAETTIYNLNCWQENKTTENELTNA
ncbi:2-hydroxyacid dehydrogenase [Tenacibaculum caenipelagi]|uniref:D-lactate dehydrogenase n=1 Tax=Tenacibaculum caenipelagi TaxID=1325435 RepID=A0A4R6TC77_9FLAO|nr:2-hydroxyacid dehydrogenase [Tenacibaculum caenipelagi]TDQ21942.1 D-lactate dehydrogenase [Tenacibaculum caenipelagi]